MPAKHCQNAISVQVFVAGASGGSGKLVVQQLAAKGVGVRAGVRVSSPGKGLSANRNYLIQLAKHGMCPKCMQKSELLCILI